MIRQPNQRNSDKAVRVFAAALAATTPALATEPAPRVEYATHGTDLPWGEAGPQMAVTASANVPTVRRIERPTSWTKALARRFHELSKKEALEQINPEEQGELDALTVTRRELQFPRSADDIIAEIRQREAITKLVQALHACAKAIPTHR